MTIERRAELFELRAEGRRLTGYAAVFGKPTRILDFTETVQRGAFAKSLAAGGDILALVDHERSKVLGRTRAGTLTLTEDAKGLRFETDELPNTSYANDALELVRTGNIGGASFAFRVPRGGEKWDGNRRTLTQVDLREVSLVSAWPAYSGTSVNLRSRYAASADIGAFIRAVRATAESLRR
jgi:HK97 family phage prohead protease